MSQQHTHTNTHIRTIDIEVGGARLRIKKRKKDFFLKKTKKKIPKNQGEVECGRNCHSSAAATTWSLMLTVGMLGHLSGIPRPQCSTVKDLVIPETGKRGQYGTKSKRAGVNQLSYISEIRGKVRKTKAAMC